MMIILERRGQLSLDTKLRSWNENSLIVIIFQDSEDMRLLSLLISLRDRLVGGKKFILYVNNMVVHENVAYAHIRRNALKGR